MPPTGLRPGQIRKLVALSLFRDARLEGALSSGEGGYDVFMRTASLILLSALSVFVLDAAALDINNTTGTDGLIMIDKRAGLVRFFDPKTLKEISNINLQTTYGLPPHELAISPDRKTAYVPLYGDGVYGRNPNPGHTIVVIDLPSRQVSGTIDLSPNLAPHGLQVDEKGKLYVVCDSSRTLLIVDPKAKKVEATIDTEGTGHWLAMTPGGSKAYVANKQDRLFLSVIDLKARKMVGKVPMPKGTQGIIASPDGKRVIAADLADPKLVVVDTATDQVVDTIKVQDNRNGPFRVRYSPDGKTVVTLNSGSQVANIFDASNLQAPQKVVKVGREPFGVAFTADSKTALVSNHGDGTISVIDLQQGRVVNTFAAGTGIETLSYY
jgi:YVTN family beta-propeller protein